MQRSTKLLASSRTGLSRVLAAIAAPLLLAGILACGDEPEAASDLAENELLAAPDAEARALLDRVIASEELIEGLRSSVNRLAFSAANLRLPDERSRALFWPLEVRVWDLSPTGPAADASETDPSLLALGARTSSWSPGPARVTRARELAMWQPLLSEIDYFENSKFKIKRGRFLEGEPQRFETDVKFTGLARMKSGGLAWLKAKQVLRWRLLPGKDPGDPDHWRIEEWELLGVERMDTPHLMFEEVLDFSLPEPADRRRARANRAERLDADRILATRQGKEFEIPELYELGAASDRHPGIAVVDLDRDGFDDFYVMQRLGPNQFFRNRGDGTFEEIAAELGIDVDSYTSAALFADFDNDGDDDLFLGGTGRPSRYYENREGRFVDTSEQVFDAMTPRMVSSISAVDYDGDGLLDLYVTTYAASKTQFEDFRGLLTVEEAREVHHRRWDLGQRVYYDIAGPPNVLLHNQGDGRFHKVEDPGPLAAWRNSFQATWSDYDGDGDPDVYLSNDFAPDNLFRNDGNGKFVDVSREAGITHFGWGMGASWGDYDRDGRVDLYATNMYSTAGTRITEQLPWLNPNIVEATSGNFLYRHEGSRFRKVSEREPPGLTVQETGWSWGSQFSDVDNDGYLDLAVLNGFYTAPKEVALSGDT